MILSVCVTNFTTCTAMVTSREDNSKEYSIAILKVNQDHIKLMWVRTNPLINFDQPKPFRLVYIGTRSGSTLLVISM